MSIQQAYVEDSSVLGAAQGCTGETDLSLRSASWDRLGCPLYSTNLLGGKWERGSGET